MTEFAAAGTSPRIEWTVPKIARAINRRPRAVYHALEHPDGPKLPGAKKVGGVWCLNLDVFNASFAA